MSRSRKLSLLEETSEETPQPPAAEGARRSKDRSKGRGRIFSALRYRNYRLFWTGQLVSVTGTFMQSTAQQWLVLTLSGNPLDLGIVSALQFGPLLVLAPFGGAIADRWPRRVLLMITQSVAGSLAFALWLLTMTGLVQIWHVFLLATLLGLVNAVDLPTRQAFVSEMVPAESLLNAVSLNSAQFNVSRILGPGIAGAVIALLGVPVLFLLNAISYVAVITGLLLMRPAELMLVPRAAVVHGVARLRAMGDGARFVLANPTVRITFIMVTVAGIFGFNFSVLVPLEATRVLFAGPAVFGLLTSSLGIGALVGALVLARRRGPPTNKLLIGMAAFFGLLLASVAFTHAIPVAMALLAATGLGMSSFSASANTRVQLASPPELRGRVMSFYMMAFAGTTPIGSLIVSGIVGVGGVPLGFIVSGVPCFAVAVLAAVLWRRQDKREAKANPMASLPIGESAGILPPPPAWAPPMSAPTVPGSVASEPAMPELLPVGCSLPARLPYPAPGHPAPQPRAADAD